MKRFIRMLAGKVHDQICDRWIEAQFQLRTRWLGKVCMRDPSRAFQQGSLKSLNGENALYERVFHQALKRTPEGHGAKCVIDVGCRNWSYVHVLAQVFPQAHLVGVEVDWARRMFNLFRRGDLIRAAVLQLQARQRSAEAFFGDFLDYELSSHAASPVVVLFLFPFVSGAPCQAWGLPRRFANFEGLVRRAQKIKASTLISCHQGEWEAACARAVYARTGTRVRETVVRATEIASIWPARHDVHIFTSELTTEVTGELKGETSGSL